MVHSSARYRSCKPRTGDAKTWTKAEKYEEFKLLVDKHPDECVWQTECFGIARDAEKQDAHSQAMREIYFLLRGRGRSFLDIRLWGIRV